MRLILVFFFFGLLAGCAGPKYTIDDGRKVNEALLGEIRAYGQGEKALRPAIVRASTLKDPECDTQWELPFSVASSYDESEDDRVAWVRGLGVDERLTVIGAAPDSPLKINDKIQKIGAFETSNTEKMLLLLAKQRDEGFPFEVTLTSNKKARIVPFKVCRGYTRLAPPKSPKTQDYHWLLSVQPLDVARVGLTEDEALWVVLWAQGVSEEGGLRMKSYHYSKEIASTVYTLFTIASGIHAAALASEAALNIARSTATSMVSDVIRNQLLEGASTLREKLSPQQVQTAMQQAAANRKSLSGVAWVASTMFEEADAWAYTRLKTLKANPLAAFTLHQKLIERKFTSNSMILDPERFKALNKLAEDDGRGEDVIAILQGIRPEDLQFEISDMPVASADAFSYDDMRDSANGSQPYAHGLVDGMLNMPVASGNAN
ncbi:MAG: hypothetical protein HY849_11010 [Nitrosomonadales bacterium]|nr:hypothetical protein [Nitrosomonadales bacterium]